MISPWLPLAACTALLMIMMTLAMYLPPVPRALLFAQVAYFSLSFVLRPAILIIVAPSPVFGDSLADTRLASDGYTSSLASVLWICAAGLGIYTLCLVIYVLYARQHRYQLRVPDRDRSYWNTVLLMCFVLGQLGRMAQVFGASSNLLIVEILQYIAIAGANGLIIAGKTRRRWTLSVLLSVCFASELIWSALSVSKTPFMAALLSLGIRLTADRMTRKRIVGLALAVIAGIAVFAPLQSLKSSDETAAVTHSVDLRYPTAVRPLLDIARRFDMLSAVTDAYYAGPARWNPPPQFFSTALSAIIPAPFQESDKAALGTQWAEQVRQISKPNSNVDVSLASGFIAEGWVTAGLWGLIGQSIYLVVALHIVSRLLAAQSLTAFCFGVLCVALPILFERGMLTGLELASKSFQAVPVIFLIALLIRTVHLSISPTLPSRRQPEIPRIEAS